jgi:multiple sugar transport system permease protein
MNGASEWTGPSLIKEMWKSRASYLLMAPFLFFFIVFTIVPVVSSFILSFTNFNMLQTPSWVGWLNYERLFLDDEVFLQVVQNTLIFAFITGPISYLISFLLAWFINEFRPWLRSVLTLIFYAPTLAGNLFFMWAFIFSGDQYGLLNGWLMRLGIVWEPINWLWDPQYTLGVIILVQFWMSLGAGFLAFIAGFQTIDRSLFEAGVIDGVKNRWQELWYITLPSMAPQLLFGAVMQISASFGVSFVVTSLAGFPTRRYAADTIVTYIQDHGTVRFEMGYASAIAVFMFVIMLVMNRVITRALRYLGSD